jgi:hypothetical protein
MKKVLFIGLFLIFGAISSNAQQKLPPDQKFEYFLDIQGVSGKVDIEAIENSVVGKPGVSFFQSNKQNHKYFILRTSVPFTQAQCEALVNHGPYMLVDFAVDTKQKEALVKRKR